MSSFGGSPRQTSSYLLTRIFSLFDTDKSEAIDLDVELKQFVQVLLRLRGNQNPTVAAVNALFDVLKPRLVRFCRTQHGELSLSEFIAAMRDPATLVSHEWIGDALTDFFDRRNFPVLKAEFPFQPGWEYQELEDWHELPQGLECTMPLDNSRKMARIPEKNWQVGFRLDAQAFPPDGRMLQVKINKTDTVADVLRRIANDWPGLRGRNFQPPSADSLQLRKQFGRVYFPDERVVDIGYQFKSEGFCVELLRGDAAAAASSTAGGGGAPMAQPSAAPPAIDPSLERLVRCCDRIADLRTSLLDERRRFQQRLDSLEGGLNQESDEGAALADTLGGRFKADRDDLKTQIVVLREQIGSSRLADLSDI